jgi:hypothetical protein
MKTFFALICGFVLGMLCWKQNFFPRPQIHYFKRILFQNNEQPASTTKNLLCVVDYDGSEPIFSDRNYTCSVGNEYFKETKLIKVPKHAVGEIWINILEPLRIYRPITLVNDNSYYANWKKAYFPIKITSNTCTYEHIVYKDFEPGITILPFGGPVSTDPLFIKSLNDIPLGLKAFELLAPDSDSQKTTE